MSSRINRSSDLCKREIGENTLAQNHRTNIAKLSPWLTVFVTIAVKNGSHRNQVGGKFSVYLSYNSNPAYINRSTKLLKLYKYPKDP